MESLMHGARSAFGTPKRSMHSEKDYLFIATYEDDRDDCSDELKTVDREKINAEIFDGRIANLESGMKNIEGWMKKLDKKGSN
jgi:hypothetical protein